MGLRFVGYVVGLGFRASSKGLFESSMLRMPQRGGV